MKKLLLTAMVMGAILFSTSETKAQLRVGVNINIGGRPGWGLPGNYAGDYYYMPEIDTYYDIPHRQFIYLQGNNWVFSYDLPYQYRNYDLARGYKVAINESRPYLRGNWYRARYNSYYDNYQRRNGFYGRDFNDCNHNGRDDRFEKGRDDRFDRNDRFDNKGRDKDRDHDRGWNGGRRG